MDLNINHQRAGNFQKVHAFDIPIDNFLYNQLEQLNNAIQNYENGLSK